jgi:N-alpha-acetyl-L-2,4-diaminobutyrate deacetylase
VRTVKIDELDFFIHGKNHYLLEVAGERLPITTISGGSGERICFTAGQHGNEWNGIRTLLLLREKLPEKINGTIIILPTINPPAFLLKQRTGPDGIDMNRIYPDHMESNTGRLGNLLYSKIFEKHDYLIDIHSGGPGTFIPHVRVPKEEDVHYGRYFLFEHIWVRLEKEGLIAPTIRKLGVRSCTIEIGGGRRVEIEIVEKCLHGLLNFLKKRGVIPGHFREPGNYEIYNKRVIPKVEHMGFLKVAVKLGDKVEKGQVIAMLKRFEPGDEKILTSPCEGTVGYVRREAAVVPGDSVIHIFT